MRIFTRAVCLLLCMCMLPVFAAGAEDAAPQVRVQLKRLNITDRMDLFTEGAFTLELATGSELLLPGNAEVTAVCRGEEIVLFIGGMSVTAGQSVCFLPNVSDSGRSGHLKLAKGDLYYPGELQLKAAGGQLMPVLTLSVEEYLKGVVPYEMSDDFPLEALKVQAVCARTYAISHLNPEKDWDLVDTTNDQVFKGINPADRNAARAIEETAGVIVLIGGRPATCYYAASNGGQTDLPSHVWPGMSDEGYGITDDPYDIENPESIVLKTFIPGDGSLPEGALLSALREELLPQLQKDGYTGTAEEISLTGITHAELTSPRFEEPCRQMTGLTLTVTVAEGKETPTPEPTPAPGKDALEEEDIALFAGMETVPEYTVELPLFPELIRELKLSIGGDNEILTLTEERNGWTLTSGRYGHGVGMSQRGAEWMAKKYGKSMEEILSFYYPGAELAQTGTGEIPPATPDPVLAVTPGPAATPTPRPTLMPVTADDLPEGAYLATVENIAEDSSLNLRKDPSPVGEILMRLYRHQELIVLETCEDPEWVRVRTDSIEGYVKIAFLEKK